MCACARKHRSCSYPLQTAHAKTLSLLLSVQREGSARRLDVFVANGTKGAAPCEVRSSRVTVGNEEGRSLSSWHSDIEHPDAKTSGISGDSGSIE